MTSLTRFNPLILCRDTKWYH